MLTLQDVKKEATKMLSYPMDDYVKIEIKCWIYNSEVREKTGDKIIHFKDYSNQIRSSVPLNYIKFDFIDVTEFGGKENAIKIVEDWYKNRILNGGTTQ